MGELTGGATAALAVAAAAAAVDWWAVQRARRPLEHLAKPATLAALVLAAVALDPADPAQRAWFVAGLVASLAGDVLLMVDERRLGPVDTFTAGLGAFLLGHVAYIVGFAVHGYDVTPAVVLVVAPLAIGPRIVRGARPHGMALPVGLYIAVIAAMFASALASGSATAALGAALFVASDAMIGWSRFVRAFAGHRLAIIITYHVAQALLVVNLTT